LPALPKAWSKGSLRGLRVRGGLELDISWAVGRPTLLVLRGRPQQRVMLRHGQRSLAVLLNEAGRARLGSLDLDRDAHA